MSVMSVLHNFHNFSINLGKRLLQKPIVRKVLQTHKYIFIYLFSILLYCGMMAAINEVGVEEIQSAPSTTFREWSAV